MSKQTSIDIGILSEILRGHLAPEQKAEIMKEINKAMKEEEEVLDGEKEETEKDKPAKVVKKQVIIFTALPEKFTEEDLEGLAGFVTTIPEETPIRELKGMVKESRAVYSNSKKAKKNPADSLGELFEIAPLSAFKEAGILKKPQGPLEFTYCPNN